jgi:hypothetical protein
MIPFIKKNKYKIRESIKSSVPLSVAISYTSCCDYFFRNMERFVSVQPENQNVNCYSTTQGGV